jgi:hypothetical protein
MRRIRVLAAGLAALAAVGLVVGCSPSPTTGGTKPGTASGDHTHGAGPHGGALADFGGDKYHVEFTVDHPTQQATVYVLVNDPKFTDDKLPAAPIKATDGELALSIKGPKSGQWQMVLKANPQQGDPEGKSSRFVGKHEKLGVEQEFEGDIEGDVEGAHYTGHFKEEPESPKK